MRLGELARGGVELWRDLATWIPFAHHRLKEHRLDVPAVGVRIGKGLAQLFDRIGRDGDQLRLVVLPARQVLGIGRAGAVGVEHRQFGAAVEGALDRDALDPLAGMAATRIGVQLGVDVGDPAGQRDRLRAGIQAQEFVVGAAAAAMADFALQCLRELQLRQAGGHDVGHHLWPRHGLDHRLRRMAEPEHAVAPGVVQHRALEGDHPGAAGSQRHIRIHRVIRVEIDVVGVDGGELLGLFGAQKGIELAAAQGLEGRDGSLHGFNEFGVLRTQALDSGFVETTAAGGAAVAAQGLQALDQARHGGVHLAASPGWRGRCARSTQSRPNKNKNLGR